MAMSQSTLATELANLAPAPSEAAAIVTLVDAYATFCEDATALSPILAGGITLGRGAMSTALVGMNNSGQGAAKWASGMNAFWTAVAGGLATSFAGATAITPPSPVTSGATQTIFDANRDLERSLVDSTDALATLFHGLAIVGGTVTTVGPTVTPII